MIRTGERAWLVLLVIILAYEMSCRDGELLSHAVDRWLAKRPWVVFFIVISTACHLLNFYDRAPRVIRVLDPYTTIGLLRRWT